MLLQANLNHQPGTEMWKAKPLQCWPRSRCPLSLMVLLTMGSLPQFNTDPAGLCTSQPCSYSKVRGTTNSEQAALAAMPTSFPAGKALHFKFRHKFRTLWQHHFSGGKLATCQCHCLAGVPWMAAVPCVLWDRVLSSKLHSSHGCATLTPQLQSCINWVPARQQWFPEAVELRQCI